MESVTLSPIKPGQTAGTFVFSPAMQMPRGAAIIGVVLNVRINGTGVWSSKICELGQEPVLGPSLPNMGTSDWGMPISPVGAGWAAEDFALQEIGVQLGDGMTAENVTLKIFWS